MTHSFPTRRSSGLDSARQLVLQTALGAARLAISSADDPAALRRKVTSPGGTTAAAIGVFEQANFTALVEQALVAARDRRSEEHTSELQSLMRISYAVFCLKKKTNHQH